MNWTKALTGTTLAAAFGIGLFAALPSQAQDEMGMGMGMGGQGMGEEGMMTGGPGAGPMVDFATLDADKDGKVTKAEITAARTAHVLMAPCIVLTVQLSWGKSRYVCHVWRVPVSF